MTVIQLILILQKQSLSIRKYSFCIFDLGRSVSNGVVDFFGYKSLGKQSQGVFYAFYF